MKTSLSGITLHVANVEQSKAFYLRIPGASLLFERPGDYAIVQIGAARVGMLRQKIVTGQGVWEGTGFHLEIGTDDLDTLRARLQAVGIAPAGPQPEEWGQQGMIARDPDGYVVEFDDHLGAA